jgi:homoserine kinase
MTATPRLRVARIQVPASTSNLGAGFDCLGVALARHLAAAYDPDAGPQDGPPQVERRGTLHVLSGRPDGDDVFMQAFEHGLATHGATLRGGTLTLDSEIPVARGLGSSAAAVVGGLALAAAVTGSPLVRADVLAAALRWESHLDNVSAALIGGLVAVTHDEAGAPRTLHLPLASDIGFAYAAPGVGLETARARAVLPRTIAFADAVHNVGAMAALTAGLATGDPDLIALGLSDRLHVQYRLPLIPGAADALAAAHSAGAWGATISGAGSGLIALTQPDRARAVAEAMARAFRDRVGPDGVVCFAVDPDRAGAVSVPPAPA